MTSYIKGEEYQAFRDALERVALDFTEALELASCEPADASDWRATYQELTDAWFRMGSGIADMVLAATGEDISHCFARSDDQ